ncbi:MAG: YopX family protein [Streptococcaceae bacterium]|jgi:uncharacterized phage protein (TIGR01671 family)|nr:YopX family protein [Streptococcaceae bacterium]MCH4177286.1 YopX family protein [Streptococcaceae bacterium]
MIPKFRAFIKRTEQIEDVTEIDFETEDIEVSSGSWYEIDKVVLMQSTGKSDIKGNEIWQKSIVKVENHPFQKDKNGCGIEIDGNYLVEWNDEDLTWCVGNLLLFRLLPYVTVVGDYYRNPELLEGE